MFSSLKPFKIKKMIELLSKCHYGPKNVIQQSSVYKKLLNKNDVTK
jgi:hypothetical protein